MRTKVALLLVLFFLIINSGFSQSKSKKELKEEQKIEQQKRIEALVNSREFRFVARTAIPTGMRSVNLISNPNFVKFQPDMIESEMPFFGRAYSGIGYGGDSGLKFKGPPAEFTVTKGKKGYVVNAAVNGTTDSYKMVLNISFQGSASLSITSNKRSTISYHGEIFGLDINN